MAIRQTTIEKYAGILEHLKKECYRHPKRINFTEFCRANNLNTNFRSTCLELGYIQIVKGTGLNTEYLFGLKKVDPIHSRKLLESMRKREAVSKHDIVKPRRTKVKDQPKERVGLIRSIWRLVW